MATNQRFKERFIGRGAMGDVYELEGHKPPAVIKYMFCGNGKQLRIFKTECEALKKINHCNVVGLYQYIEEGIRVGIVMEYCQRGSLRDVIFNPTISYSMNTVLTWGIQLFEAIGHMYQKHKLVHRDIKPDNIFVTNEYQLKIGDFGLVKVVGDGTVTGTFIGTQRYMSPPDMKEDEVQPNVYKQVMEADVSNSHRNDVYSLGLVVWEIIERRAIFTKYERSGMFDRDQLLIDIALKRVTEIESPECPSEIQKIIMRCTNFQRIHRPAASKVFGFLAQTQKTNQFISSLPFMPTEDKNQKELMKPIGFDDRKEWVMVGSEEGKYIKRFDKADYRDSIPEANGWILWPTITRSEASIWQIPRIKSMMRDKLGTLNSAERDKFFKEAPNIVSRLKEETQTFKDARYVIEEILKIEVKMENLRQKNISELFELFVLGNFGEQHRAENYAFENLKGHEEIWISSFGNWNRCAYRINHLKKIKREEYTTNFYFRCFISQLTGEGWIHIEKDRFVSEDLRIWKEIPGRWVDNPRAEIRSYENENKEKKHEIFHFSHYKQIPLERIIKTFKKEQKRIESIIKLYLKYLIPIDDSEKNNVPFNIESLFEESYDYRRAYGPYRFPHYIFQLRNPPRSICQKNHSGKCEIDGFRKTRKKLSDLPKELHIPVCGESTKDEVWFLECYMGCAGSNRGLIFQFQHPFLFLCCQHLDLDIPFLILLDHPNNYENGESIPAFDLKKKLHHINVGVLRECFQESRLNERVYALIKHDGLDIRLIDYQGNPKEKWLTFEKVSNSASYSEFTKQKEATISS